jgi:hypothetical protein
MARKKAKQVEERKKEKRTIAQIDLFTFREGWLN